MQRRTRLKHPESLGERLAATAAKLRKLAFSVSEGSEKESLLRKADECNAAMHMDGWLSSKELRAPR